MIQSTTCGKNPWLPFILDENPKTKKNKERKNKSGKNNESTSPRNQFRTSKFAAFVCCASVSIQSLDGMSL